MTTATGDLKWTTDVEVGGTFYRGMFNETDGDRGRFAETVARLLSLSGQSAVGAGDADKQSVEFIGTFKGETFTLYDYKSDFDLHIGGREGLDVRGLIEALRSALATATPVPFKATATYEKRERYGWPNR